MRRMTLGLVGLLASGIISAREIRVVRFQTLPPDFSPPPCISFVQWVSETYFHNTTDTNQAVRFLGVSNGDVRPNPRPLIVPTRQTVVLRGESVLDWEPVQRSVLWINRLDLPEGIVVANRLVSAIFTPDHIDPPCTGRGSYNGGPPLQIFTGLTPAGKPQYHLGIGLGSTYSADPFAIANARFNVGLYNGGSVAATAVVQVYCGQPLGMPIVPNDLIKTEQISIPANTLVQRTVVGSTMAAGCASVGLPTTIYYAIVTVDQPSLSYAVGLSNDLPPRFPAATSFTYSGE